MKKKTRNVVEYSKLQRKVAALWTRVSTEHQELYNCSLENQKRICQEYAERNGITIKREFGGTHESAKEEGKMYKNMISEVAKDGEINIILVYSFDRFTRSGNEGIMTKAYLKSKGIYVISATQVTDPDSAVGVLMENIIFLFNQFENQLRRDKSVLGMTECLRKGDWYAKAPRGYDHKKVGKRHILTINDEGRILKNAFLWKANENVSDVVIAKRLKAMGVKIDRKRVTDMLHNPFYCGYIRHNLLGNELIKGNQEKLIDEETFKLINGLSSAGYEQREETEEFPLKRHVRCAECGGYLTGYTVKKKGCMYYKCNKKGCKSNHNVNKMHEKYISLLEQYQVPPFLHPILCNVLGKVYDERHIVVTENKTILLKRQTELERKLESVKIKCGMGEIPIDVYESTMSHINEQLSSLHHELEKCNENVSNKHRCIDEALVISCKLCELWKDGDFSTRQSLQKLVFPNGVLFDKHSDSYRTDSENEVFEVFRVSGFSRLVRASNQE